MSKYPDAIDRQILSLLEQNARISNAELADRVNLSPTPCLRRLRKLEKSGLIRGYKLSIFSQPILMVSWNVRLGNYVRE